MVHVQFRKGLKQTAFVDGQEVYECTGGTSSKNVATLAQLAEVASFILKTIIAVGIGMRGGSLKGKVPDAVVEASGDLVAYPVKTRNGTYYVVFVEPKDSPGSRGAPAAQVARGKPTAQKPAPQGELAAAPSKRSAAQRQKTPAISSLRQRQTQPAESARGAARRGASSKSPIEVGSADEADDEGERHSKGILSRRDQKVDRVAAPEEYGKDVGLAKEFLKINIVLQKKGLGVLQHSSAMIVGRLVGQGTAPPAVQDLFVRHNGELILDERKLNDTAVLALTQVNWGELAPGGLSKYSDRMGLGQQGVDGRIADIVDKIATAITSALPAAAPTAAPAAAPATAPAAAPAAATLTTSAKRARPQRLSELDDGGDVTDLAQDLHAHIKLREADCGRGLAAVIQVALDADVVNSQLIRLFERASRDVRLATADTEAANNIAAVGLFEYAAELLRWTPS
ncbi:hypothetical protein M885DRAFT_546808 [Pelagophyceae sp. CCMP2097]|nr:hypothetical protein M885DRAFT_546808 [Pelagophyceae sp. CCMP2097]